MIDREKLKEGYQEKHGRPMSEADCDAMYRMVRAFDCEDSESYEEAHRRVLASMDSIDEDLREATDDLEARDVIARRLAGFRRG